MSAPDHVSGAEHPDHPIEWFWRVESTHYWNSYGGCEAHIYYNRYAPLRHTKRGVWLVPYENRNPHFSFEVRNSESLKKLVVHGTRRAWAYPTKKLAWGSFVIRQRHRVQHCKNALEAAETVFAMAKTIDGGVA